jgi:hypothetical protein
MSISLLNRSFKGISELSITRLNDNVTYSFPSPSNFTLNPTIGEKIQMIRNAVGEKDFGSSYTISKSAELTVTYDYMSSELVSFRLGNQLATGTFATAIPRQILATNALVPADVLGGLYFGVVADAVTSGSIVKAGISTALTQQPFATFSSATLNSFAIGANGAVKISDNLVTAGQIITLVIPITGLVGAGISDLLVGPVAIRAKLVDSLNQLTLFEAKNASINLGSANFSFDGEGSSELAFRLAPIPGACSSFNLINLGITVNC